MTDQPGERLGLPLACYEYQGGSLNGATIGDFQRWLGAQIDH